MTDKIDPSIYPLTFDPIFKDYVWGGRNLESQLGRTIPDGVVAESWEIAGHVNGSSTVRQGPLMGKTLPEVQELLGESLVGRLNRQALALGRFPLLIKLLDANRWLSVQVHPDDEYGLANEDDFGKTEMWIVLHAEPDAELVFGFRTGVTRESFADAVATGQIDETLHRISVTAGDVIFVPAGSIHALGPGTIVAEIQQNSDTTYRVYDWGRDRETHVEKALDVLDFTLIEPTTVMPKVIAETGIQDVIRREEIGHCQYFHTERLTMPTSSVFEGGCNGGTYEIWGILSGSISVEWAGESLTVEGVDWVLLPAALGDFTIRANAESTLLRVYTP